MSHAAQIADELRKIPGSQVEAFRQHSLGNEWFVRWVYACPCGERSCLLFSVGIDGVDDAEAIIEAMKEGMRDHVRSEGNEPSF